MQRSNELQRRRAHEDHPQSGDRDVQPAVHRADVRDQRRHLPPKPLTAAAR